MNKNSSQNVVLDPKKAYSERLATGNLIIKFSLSIAQLFFQNHPPIFFLVFKKKNGGQKTHKKVRKVLGKLNYHRKTLQER